MGAQNRNTSGIRTGSIPVSVKGAPASKGGAGRPGGTVGTKYSSSLNSAKSQGENEVKKDAVDAGTGAKQS